MKIYINGKFFAKEDAKISVFDHGLLYGDGIFEGIRLYSGNVFNLEKNIDRLFKSAKAIMLQMPYSKEEVIEAVCETCRQNNLTDGYIRLVVTRGAGALGLSPKSCVEPQLIIIADEIQLYPKELYETGLKIITVATRRNSPAALPPMVKSLNYLNNILAKIEAQNLGYPECLLLNQEGYVAECSGDNIFIVVDGKVITPPVSNGSLSGVTRGAAMQVAEALGLQMIEKQLTRYDVWTADECFLTGTAAKLIPVIEVDSRVIGTGKPGPITAKMLAKFNEIVSQQGVKLCK